MYSKEILDQIDGHYIIILNRKLAWIHFKIKEKKYVGSIECLFLFRNILTYVSTHTHTHTESESDILLVIKFTTAFFLHAFSHFLKFQKLLFYFYNKYANNTKMRYNLEMKSGWEISYDSLGMDMSKASLG